jgi:hypothetical protein
VEAVPALYGRAPEEVATQLLVTDVTEASITGFLTDTA